MKSKLLALAIASVSIAATAQQYSCNVNCLNPTGKTYVTVRAGSASEAADIVDKRSDAICREAGHGKSTSSTMSASQCERK